MIVKSANGNEWKQLNKDGVMTDKKLNCTMFDAEAPSFVNNSQNYNQCD